MRKALVVLGIVVALFLVVGLVWVACHLPEKEMVVQGETERDWIKSIAYNGPDQQTEAWRQLGQPGLQMLARALWRGNGTIDRNYPKFYNRLPSYLRTKLPTPHDDTNTATRMCAASLLCSLRTNAASVAPELVRVMKVEPRDSVLQLELCCFGDSGQLLTLPGMDRVKAELLPVIIRASGSRDWSTRNDALIPLRWYTNQPEVVIPLLLAGMKDTNDHVRIAAATSLHEIDPQKAVEAGGVEMLIALMKSRDNYVSHDAPARLGSWHAKPEITVPALIANLRGTNEELAVESIWALRSFSDDSRTVPALQEATRGSMPKVSSWAKSTLQSMTNRVSSPRSH